MWSGLYVVIVLVLVAAGTAKAWRPGPAEAALRQAKLPAGRAAVRLGASAEVVVGCWALTSSRIAAAAVAMSYAAFAAFVTLALRRGSQVNSCGCFGAADAPPTVGHLTFDLAAASTAAWAAVHPHPGVIDLLRGQPLAGLPLMAVVLTTSYLAYLVLAALPRTAAAGRPR